MTEQEKVNCIYAVIESAVKHMPFTFENLSVSMERQSDIQQGWRPKEVTIKFRFDEFGNMNKSLVR